jgi:hypothetical protein
MATREKPKTSAAITEWQRGAFGLWVVTDDGPFDGHYVSDRETRIEYFKRVQADGVSEIDAQIVALHVWG